MIGPTRQAVEAVLDTEVAARVGGQMAPPRDLSLARALADGIDRLTAMVGLPIITPRNVRLELPEQQAALVDQIRKNGGGLVAIKLDPAPPTGDLPPTRQPVNGS